MTARMAAQPGTQAAGPLAKVLLAMAIALLLTGCATTRRDVPRPRSEAWPAPAQTALGRAVQPQLVGAPGLSGFHALDSGVDALSLRAGLADAAEHTLDLQYYSLHEDVTTQLLIFRVLRAADRGVRVRLLVDDLYAVGRDVDLAALAASPNIEVRVFNPFLWRGAFGLSRLFELAGDLDRLNRRMHNKLWIADNAAAIIGGRNLGDIYFDAGTDVNFNDLDLLAVGPVVDELSQSFDAFWNHPLSVPIEAFVAADPGPEDAAAFRGRLQANLLEFRDSVYARALRDTRLGPKLLAGDLPLVTGVASALYHPAEPPAGDAPREPGVFQARVRAMVAGARHEIILVSPYFIPTDTGLEALGAAVRRGVRVRVLTNSLASTDVPVVHSGYARIRPQLLAAGVELHETRPSALPGRPARWRMVGSSSASLHAKAIIVDRQQVLVGSMNLDPRSRQTNTEVAVLVDSGVLGEQLARLFEAAMQPVHAYRVDRAPATDTAAPAGTLTWTAEDDGQPVRHSAEPASVWRHILYRLLGWLTPESLL
jgi:cardiolipin synthase C